MIRLRPILIQNGPFDIVRGPTGKTEGDLCSVTDFNRKQLFLI